MITYWCCSAVNFTFTHDQVIDRNNEDYGFYEAGTTRTTDNNSLYGED